VRPPYNSPGWWAWFGSRSSYPLIVMHSVRLFLVVRFVKSCLAGLVALGRVTDTQRFNPRPLPAPQEGAALQAHPTQVNLESTNVCPCSYAPVCMGVLYHISMDDKHKSLFTYTEAIKIMYTRLIGVDDLRLEPELIALAINLTQNQRCAAALCEGPNFDKLMRKSIDGQDDLLFKVMRNCSQVQRSRHACLPS
jgi:hypothetical protein